MALSCASGMSRGRQSPKPFSASWVSPTQLVPRAASVEISLQSALAEATGRQAPTPLCTWVPFVAVCACLPTWLWPASATLQAPLQCTLLAALCGRAACSAGKLCAVQSASLRASARCSGVGSNLQSTQLGCRVQAAPGQSRWWGPW